MVIHKLMNDTNGKPLTIHFLQNMTEEQALHYFGMKYEGDIKLNYRKLIHNLAFAAVNAKWKFSSISDFWYEPVKVLILRLKHLFVERCEPKAWETIKKGAVNDELSAMVKGGHIIYEDLGIIDRVTMIDMLDTELEKSQCWKNKIIFVEKDSIYEHVKPLAKLLNASLLSGRGWSNTAAIEKITRNSDQNIQYELYGIVDYDVYGDSILEEVSDKFCKLGLTITKTVKMGIYPDQVPSELIDVKKYPIKINLKSAVEWCEKYGLEGPYLEYWKTVKKVKTELIYAGTKCYGLEIQALTSIQPNGAQLFRDTILDKILEHLNEDDRIWELTGDAWEDMPRGAGQYYLDDFTWRCFTDTNLPTPLEEYITQEVYDVRKEIIDMEKRDELKPWEVDLERIETQINVNEEFKDEAISENESTFDEQIQEAEQEHIDPLLKIIYEIQMAKINPIRNMITMLNDKHVRPLEEQKEHNEDQIRDSYDQIESDLQSKRTSIEESMEGVEDDYDTERSFLDEMFETSRAIFAQSVLDWLSENRDEYYNTGLDNENCSMGVIRGFLKEACEKGETAQDILNAVENWDKDTPYEWITEDIDDCMDEVMKYVSAYVEQCKEVSQ